MHECEDHESKKYERGPMIENSDRGITLNKSLAWTVGTGLIAAGLYVGLTIATMSGRLDEGARVWNEASVQRAQLELRVRALEVSRAETSSDLRAIQNGINRIEARLDKLGVTP